MIIEVETTREYKSNAAQTVDEQKERHLGAP